MIIESQNREPIIAIHYEGWNNWYDELLPLSSSRLATLGFYTERDDIPRYKMSRSKIDGSKNGGQMQALIVNRIPQNTSWTSRKPIVTKIQMQKNLRKKLSLQENSNLTEEERRRLDNSNHGDCLDDVIEDFLNKYGDVNYNNGNLQISGLARSTELQNHASNDSNVAQDSGEPSSPLSEGVNDLALEAQIERQNIQILSQNII